MEKKRNQAICEYEMCEKSMGQCSLLRLASIRVTISKIQKTHFYIWFRGVCVLNFRSLSFLVWSGGVAQPHMTPTNETFIQSNKRKHTLSHVDFENFSLIKKVTLSISKVTTATYSKMA